MQASLHAYLLILTVFTLRDGTTNAYVISEVTRRARVYAIFVESTDVMNYPLSLFWGKYFLSRYFYW